MKEGICVVTTNQEYDACLVYFAQKRNLYSLHFKFVVLVVHAYYSLFLFLIFLCVLKSLLSRFLFLVRHVVVVFLIVARHVEFVVGVLVSLLLPCIPLSI